MSEIFVSKGKSAINIPYVHEFLMNSYWAKGRTLEQVTRSMEQCTCYGIYADSRQIGFARVLTDHVVFAYIMDVFIDSDFRGHGYSKQLLDAIHSDTDLINVQTWYLKTANAHNLYKQYEYSEIEDVSIWMERKNI